MIGTDSFSAFWKSLSIVLLNSCFALAKPNSATVKPGLALLKAGDSVEQRLHPRVGCVQVALHVELDQLRAPVLRDLTGSAGAQVRHLRHRPQLHEHALHGRAESRVGDGSR